VSFIRREPVAFWGGITVLVEALIALALVFEWVDWTGEQTGAVMGVVAALGAILVVVVRSQVRPEAAAQTAIAEALATPVPSKNDGGGRKRKKK
jgi:hypothetical protein